ncbi:MAG: glycosyltransferase family 2 protein [candidate division WOR-3 bacterium]
MSQKILIVIPAYNEEKNIGNLLKKIKKISPLKDVLVVDDGSKDNTSLIAKKIGCKVLSFERNQGKGAALKRGFDFAIRNGYDLVITMDGDGQHDPSEIPKFLKTYELTRADLIIGTREHNLAEMPFLRFMVNNLTSFITSILCRIRVHDSQSGFRLISKKVLTTVTLKTGKFQMETEIIIEAARRGFLIKEIPIKIIYFEKFKSHINPLIDTLRFIKLAIGMLWR